MKRPAGGKGRSSGGDNRSGAEREAIQRATELYHQGKFGDALTVVDTLLGTSPHIGDAWNLKGVLLNNLSRSREALVALEEGRRRGANPEAVAINSAKAYLALGEVEKASDAARQAIRINPKSLEGSLALARARLRGGDPAGGLQALQPALLSNPRSAKMRELRSRLLRGLGRLEDALKDIDIALQAEPSVELGLERATLLITLGRVQEGLSAIEAIVAQNPTHASALRALADYYFSHKDDREGANDLLRRSLAASFDISTAGQLAFSLMASRGEKEKANIEEAHTLVAKCLDNGLFDVRGAANFISALNRTADYRRLAKIDVWNCAEFWAKADVPGALHSLLARVVTREDRVRLLQLHKLWGDTLVRRASAHPLPALARRTAPRSKIRVGIMSSDLKHHPVCYFALPIFEHFDRDRFEIYAYSFSPGAPDRVQSHVMSLATGFRTIVGGSDREVATQMRAADLDILFELGGSTHLNRISVLAHRVAPVQVSWLGYPNSIGLPTIDRILVDPYLKPSPDLLLEQPFEMPRSWVSFSEKFYSDDPAVDPTPPLDRKGHLTFGTANNPMKYTPHLFGLWARVMREVPGSRFLFIRPEGAVDIYRKHILAEFEAGGIDASRIEFRPIRAQHLPHYNDIDIALDCVPHTGGTTTVESLWMAVPVVTRIGEAFYERLSYSNLTNAGLGDLCAKDDEGYVATALKLAADTERIRHLRKNLRQMVKASPLYDGRGWVSDWQNVITSLVGKP